MKKKILITVIAAIAVTSSALGIAACSKKDKGIYYTVTFETNGGTEIESLKLKQGQQITKPADPAKDFYKFENWYSDAAFTTSYTFGAMPAQDVTIYANWIGETTYTITFDSNGGSAVEEIALLSGTPVTEPEAPTRAGYKFGGWYNGEAKYDFTVMPAQNVTLTAKWDTVSSNKYITYMLDGEVNNVDFVVSGRKATEYKVEVTEDLEVIGWFTDPECTQRYDFNTAVTQDKTLYAVTCSKGLTIENGVVTGYTGGENAVIPAYYDGKAVTAIAGDAFLGNNTVVNVTLPETLKTVGAKAFYNCAYLFDIDLKDVTEVGERAFYGCQRLRYAGSMENLTEIKAGTFTGCLDLREAVTSSKLLKVGDYAFADCAMLAKIELSDSVTAVGDYAFSGTPISEISLPKNLETLGEGVFAGCPNLKTVTVAQGNTRFEVKSDGLTGGATLVKYLSDATDFTVPSYITKIAKDAFSGNRTLQNLTIGADVECAMGALKGMQALKSLKISALPTNPDTNVSYLSYLFGAATPVDNGVSGNFMPETLTKVTIEQGIENLPAYAFYGCNKLAEIEGLQNVRTLGLYSLAYTAISSVELGAGFTSFENDDPQKVFYGAANLKTITLAGGASCGFEVYDNCLYQGSVLAYVPAGKTAVQFKTGITDILAGAFEFSSVTELTIPATITDIKSGALRNVSGLTKLTVPFIGGSATKNNYMPYIFGATYAEVPDEEEEGKTKTEWTDEYRIPALLKEITVNGKVTKISDYAFYNMQSLKKVNFTADSVITGYGKYSFCSTSIDTLPDLSAATIIGEGAFTLCDGLTEIVIPGNIKTVEAYAFSQLEYVTDVTIEEGVEEIGDYAFAAFEQTYIAGGQYVYGCLSSLEKVVIPASVKKIGKGAFFHAGSNFRTSDMGYDYLEDFELTLARNSNLEEIGDEAFAYTAIKKIDLGAKLKTIGGLAFSHCELLKEVQIGELLAPSALETIYGGAFNSCPNLTSLKIYKQVTSAEQVPQILPYVDAEETEYKNILEDSDDCEIFVPSASLSYFTAAAVWKELAQTNGISAI